MFGIMIMVMSVIWFLIHALSSSDSKSSHSNTTNRNTAAQTRNTTFSPAAGIKNAAHGNNKSAAESEASNSSADIIFERDNNLRSFMVRNTEGEFCRVNTADKSSRFYGPTWTRILGAYEDGEFIRGIVKSPMRSREGGRLSGYTVDIGGVEAFMPISKAAWFYHPENNPVGKCIAVSIESVYTGGAKAGNVIISAWEPLKAVLKAPSDGDTMYGLAMDHDGSNLIFPLRGNASVRVPLKSAMKTAHSVGMNCGADLLTGHIWQLRTRGKTLGDIFETISVLKD